MQQEDSVLRHGLKNVMVSKVTVIDGQTDELKEGRES